MDPKGEGIVVVAQMVDDNDRRLLVDHRDDGRGQTDARRRGCAVSVMACSSRRLDRHAFGDQRSAADPESIARTIAVAAKAWSCQAHDQGQFRLGVPGTRVRAAHLRDVVFGTRSGAITGRAA